MPRFAEIDATVTLADQLSGDGGPVVLVNTFTVAAAEADSLVAAWADDAALMRRQAGFISTQLHRGIAGSGTFLDYAVWESVAHVRAAFTSPEFRARLGAYPQSVTVSPHLFRKVAVPGICVA